jgi:hypothetical protein
MLLGMRSVAIILRGCAVLIATGVTAACTANPSAPAAEPLAAATPAATASAAGTHSPSTTPTSAPAPKPTPKPKPKPKPRVSIFRVRTADGAVVTVAVFRGPVRFVLHNGSQNPGWAASVKGVRYGPAVGSAERRHLLAAFNGGFRLGVGAGGYEQEGHVVSPLVSGYASLIIDRSGRARIGVWGYGAPARNEAVYSVRQNLRLLVEHGRPTPAAADPSVWGATLGGGAYVARSAVGEDAAGDLLYAGSMSAVPADLAVALARHGARVAMELDINPEWVQLDVASRPGGPLHAEVPGQSRPADQFLRGWTRDYFTVLANS